MSIHLPVSWPIGLLAFTAYIRQSEDGVKQYSANILGSAIVVILKIVRERFAGKVMPLVALKCACLVYEWCNESCRMCAFLLLCLPCAICLVWSLCLTRLSVLLGHPADDFCCLTHTSIYQRLAVGKCSCIDAFYRSHLFSIQKGMP